MKNITKTILFAAIATALILPAGLSNISADKDNHGQEIRSLFTDVDNDIKAYVNGDMNDPTAKKSELKATHADKLDKIVSKISKKVNHEFSDEEREGLKDLIIREHISEMYRQKIVSEIPEDAITETIEIGELSAQGFFELPAAYASAHPYPITSWKQVTVDRTGGTGTDSASNDYDINGDNDFSSLSISYTSTKSTYTLTFDDEDHPDPDWDDFWDDWRQVRYNRTTDIETFTVDSTGVVFDGIWSNGKTFAEFWGQHEDKTRTYSSGMSIYISNVWNHSLDTINENSGMAMTTWTT